MKINQYYQEAELEAAGMTSKELIDRDYKVFSKNKKVYFFEPLESGALRLYSIISERSFFL